MFRIEHLWNLRVVLGASAIAHLMGYFCSKLRHREKSRSVVDFTNVYIVFHADVGAVIQSMLLKVTQREGI